MGYWDLRSAQHKSPISHIESTGSIWSFIVGVMRPQACPESPGPGPSEPFISGVVGVGRGEGPYRYFGSRCEIMPSGLKDVEGQIDVCCVCMRSANQSLQWRLT